MKQKSVALRRDNVERMCADANMRPAEHTMFKGRHIYVADGFSFHPERVYSRFGIEEGDAPNGAYCTLWFVARDDRTMDCGAPIFFDANHDPELDGPSRRKGRINQAIKDAQAFIIKQDRARVEVNG